ncbi:U32 family peptidase [Methanobacterium sp.]|uniref:U32 family peptidase n=1 Tax=Methanobacterium sp. TaxID=2164 RepID=UPI0025D9712F|nr:U32 family peptidase [Methanobacterium sp.]MBI5459569.1 U32 family peptidase [Methanobacterium sp.]
MPPKNIPELLAPAGSVESLKAGVNAGADAVYLSGKRFGARQFARNFSLKEMEQAIEYAHLRGVKVYVTVNTLVKESELPRVGENLVQLYSLGVDAVIVQDLGVGRLARQLIPDLDLHCSTQMTIHNPQGVNWAAENGFKRVVLAREMSLEDIGKTANQLSKKIELEVFAHGAICYSYSGQCLLSSFIGGRSGNRGMCAQPCRKQYQLILAETDKYGKYKEGEEIPLKDHYLLSTRDLAIYSHLDRISKAPIDSIKIEGRMKPPEYVANVVKVYRDALDSIEKGRWKVQDMELSKLKMSFNRGLTRGWLMGASYESMMGRSNPGNRGLYLGKVAGYNKTSGETSIKTKTRVKPEKGDGILFKQPQNWEKSHNLWGTIIEHSPKVKKDNLLLKLRKRVEIGSNVYITRRKSLVNAADEMVSNPQLPRRIPLNLQIDWNAEMVPLVRVNASPAWRGNIETEFEADFAMEKAIKRPLSPETIIKQLQRTGGTPFIIQNISLNYPGDLFTPIGNLNHLRRQILEEIKDKILEAYKPSSEEIETARNQLVQLKKDMNLEESNLEESNLEEPHLEEFPLEESNSEELTLNKYHLNDVSAVDSDLTRFDLTRVKTHSQPIKLAIYVDCISSLEAALQAGCKRIYFQPKIEMDRGNKFQEIFSCLKHGHDYDAYFKRMGLSLLEAANLCQEYESDLIWKWPEITNKKFIDGATNLLNILPEKTIPGVMIGGMGALWALKDIRDSVSLHGSGGLNVWNHMTIDELCSKDEPLKSITLSPEISREELRKVVSHIQNSDIVSQLEFLVQGNLEALVSEDCLPCVIKDEKIIKKLKNSPYTFLGIKDFKNRIFPVEIDAECRTHVSNSVELCLLDHIPYLQDMGFNSLVIDSRSKPSDYAHTMMSLYQKALKLTTTGEPQLEKRLHSLKKQVKKISNGGITTGNFLRGVHDDN